MDTSVEQGYVKSAWIIFFTFGFLTVIAAPINLLGTPPNPPSPETMTGLTLQEMEARIPGILDYICNRCLHCHRANETVPFSDDHIVVCHLN